MTLLTNNAGLLIQGLVDTGISYIFSNFGTDHVSIIEELAEWDAQGKAHPEIFLCPHENVAIHMAAGYAAITGEGQAVMVHVDAGTANAVMGMHNMFRTRLPVLLMAGKAPFTIRGELKASRDNYVHFVQDPFDMASLVRPYVKWEYNLPHGITTREVLRRAHSVMHSDPPGPVYLTLPRETLADQTTSEQLRSFDDSRYGSVQAQGIQSNLIKSIADTLMSAQTPVAITAYLGRNPEAVSILEDLAMLCGIRIYEFNPSYNSVSRQSPCFAGFDTAQAVGLADVGLLLDVDVPWLPKFAPADDSTKWIHIDIDTIKKDFPMWGFASDVRIQADCATVLAQVAKYIRDNSDEGFHKKVEKRIKSWISDNEKRLQISRKSAQTIGEIGEISAGYLCSVIGDNIDEQDIVVNEAIRNSLFVLQQISRTKPKTLIGSAGGGLGFSGGMALGIKLAKPSVRVIQIVGDGSFHFSTPTSVYATAQRYKLPIFTVVLDNGGWQAVKEAVLRVYPSGNALHLIDEVGNQKKD